MKRTKTINSKTPKSLLQLLLLAGLMLVSTQLFAGPFDQYLPETDKSRQYVGLIFGTRIGPVALGGDSPSPIIGKMFHAFNSIILAVAGAILAYIVFVSTMNTASQGEFLGRSWSNLWVPIRAVAGVVLMAPTPGSSFSMIQATVMWFVLQGMGAANMVWFYTLNMLQQGFSVTQSPQLKNSEQVLGQAESVFWNALNANVCIKTLQKLKQENPQTQSLLIQNANRIKLYPASPATFKPSADNATVSVSGTYYIGVPNMREYEKYCGDFSVTMTAEAKNTIGTKDLSGTTQVSVSDLTNNAKTRFTAVQDAIRRMLTVTAPLATRIVNTPIANVSEAEKVSRQISLVAGNILGPAKDEYLQVITGIANPKPPGGEVKQAINLAKAYGWIHAGTAYYLLQQGESELTVTKDATNAPSVFNTPTADTKEFLRFNQDLDGLGAHLFFNLHCSQLLQQNTGETGVKGDYVSGESSSAGETAKKIIAWIIAPVAQGFKLLEKKMFQQHIKNFTKGNPLISMRKFGDNLMFSAEFMWLGLIVVSFGLLSVSSVCTALSPGQYMAFMAMLTIGMVVVGSLILLWSCGALLAIYIPLVPFMMFSIAALGWMVAVVETLIAAPIIALGLVAPSKGDELGRAATGLGLLANITLQPIILIFAFILGDRLVNAIVGLINEGIVNVIVEDTGSGFLFIFAFIVKVVLYSGLIIAVVNKCFSLVFLIPAKIFRYMDAGARYDSGIKGEEIVRDTKQSFSQGAQAMQEIQKGAAEGAVGGFKEQLAEARKRGKELSETPQIPPKGPGGDPPPEGGPTAADKSPSVTKSSGDSSSSNSSSSSSSPT